MILAKSFALTYGKLSCFQYLNVRLKAFSQTDMLLGDARAHYTLDRRR